MLKRKHSSSSFDSNQSDGDSLSSSVLSKEKEDLKNLFCNYIDRLSRKFKTSKRPKCLKEFSQTPSEIKLHSKNVCIAKQDSVKQSVHLRETDSSSEECPAPPKNNLKNFFEERISKIYDVEKKAQDNESNQSDSSEFDRTKSSSARMILEEKLSTKKRQDLVKKWKNKHFQETLITSDNFLISKLQMKKIAKYPNKNSRTASSSSLVSPTDSRNISKPAVCNNSEEQVVTQNSVESPENHSPSDKKVLDMSKSPASNVVCCNGPDDLEAKKLDENEDIFIYVSEADNKNEQLERDGEDNLFSRNGSDTKIASDCDLIEKGVEVSDMIEVSNDNISKDKKTKNKKSKHKAEKTLQKAKSSKHKAEIKSLKSSEKKSKLKSLKTNLSQSQELNMRCQSYKRDSRSRQEDVSVSRSRSRAREESRRGNNRTRYSKFPRLSSYHKEDESDDYDDHYHKGHERHDRKRRKPPNVKRVRNFLSLDSSVEEVFSNNEAYDLQEKLSPRVSLSSASDVSIRSSNHMINNKKVHSRWSRSSDESELSKNSNLRQKVDLERQKKPQRQHDSQENGLDGKLDLKKKSCTEIKKKLRKTQEKESSLDGNKKKLVNSKKKLSKVTIDLQDLITKEIVSNLQQEQKGKEVNLERKDGFSMNATQNNSKDVIKQVDVNKVGSKINQNCVNNNSYVNVNLGQETIPQAIEKTKNPEDQGVVDVSQVINNEQVAVNQLGRIPLKINFKPRVVPKNINTLMEASIKLASSKFDMLFGGKSVGSDDSTCNEKLRLPLEISSPEEDQRTSSPAGNKKAITGGSKKSEIVSEKKRETRAGDEKRIMLNGKKTSAEQNHVKPSIDQNLKKYDGLVSIRSLRSISRSPENHWKADSRRRSRSFSRSSYSSRSRDRSWRGRWSRRKRSYSYSSRSGRWSHYRSYSRSRSRSYSSRDSGRSHDRRRRLSSSNNSRRYFERRSRSWSHGRYRSYSSQSSSRTGIRRLRSYRDWSSYSRGSRSRSRWPRSRSASRRYIKKRGEDSRRRRSSSYSPRRTPESPSIDSEVDSKDENVAKSGHLMYGCGDVLNDRYQILSTLGTGTFSKVVNCLDLKSNKNAALKIIKNVQKYREAAELEIGILKDVSLKDPSNENFCIQLQATFDHFNHQCLVFDSMGLSLFEFLKNNSYQPYTLEQIKHIGYQLIKAVKFLHGIGLMHTDLKPENILFVDSDFSVIENEEKGCEHKHYNMLKRTDIRIIDFGSAVYDNDVHGDVVSTRQYRAFEVILELGWNRPCDLWSIGCILFEMYTGHTLFQTHSNVEHLVMMEAILGPFPPMMIHQSKKGYIVGGRLKWDPESKDGRYVKKNCKQFKKYMMKCDVDHQGLFDLMSQMLTYDPRLRVTAARALEDRLFVKYHNKK